VIDPSPLDPPGDHRRRHLRMLGQDRPHPRHERRKRHRPRRSLVLRRPIRRHRADHRRTPNPQLPSDLPPRNTIRNKPPDQHPILHQDHPPNLSGRPRFRPSLWPRFQASWTSKEPVTVHAPYCTLAGEKEPRVCFDESLEVAWVVATFRATWPATGPNRGVFGSRWPMI
jgi:hypothetical protein